MSKLPVRSDSATLVKTISSDGRQDDAAPDFGGGGAYGIPFKVVSPKQKTRADPLHRLRRRERSRSVPDPAERAGRGWRVEQRRPSRARRAEKARVTSTSSTPRTGAARTGTRRPASTGTSTSNKLRPLGWTSADAAGLPIFPGLVRYGEVATGCDPPRAALHRRGDPARLHLPGDARRVVVDRSRRSRRWACACG